MEHAFLENIYIAHAVCNKKCQNKEFIVDGQTQVCNKCGELLFRTDDKEYIINEEDKETNIPTDKNDKLFPTKINIVYVKCDICNYDEFAVKKEKIICQYCKKEMKMIGEKEYILK